MSDPIQVKADHSARWTTRRTVITTSLLTIAAGAGLAFLLLQTGPVRGMMQRAYDVPAGWPQRDERGLRNQLLIEQQAAMAHGDLSDAAHINATLSQEALVRANAVQRSWLTSQHERTRLYAQNNGKAEWNYRNTAADLFGFLLHAGLRLNPDTLPALQETLAAEAKLAPPGELCQPVNAITGKRVNEDAVERMFASTEYVKDGLLGVYERWGSEQPSAQRMFDVMDAVLRHSKITSRFGNLPGEGSEENGNVLQTCSRLWFTTGDERYAEMVMRIADASVQQMLPAMNGLPVRHFDYTKNRAIDDRVKIRDHGNEIIPGLAEAYTMAMTRGQTDPTWRAAADRWAEPIAAMLERLLTTGRNADGLFVSTIDPHSGKHTDKRLNDNWGYLTNGILLFAQTARQYGTIDEPRLARMEAAVDEIAQAVATQYGVAWERTSFDGYADTLESAMYTAHHRPQTAAVLQPWIDDQISVLLEMQRPDGFISNMYLDGNFIRTSLMYADMRSGNLRVVPWRSDVRVGFARAGDDVVLVVRADAPYQGTLVPDRQRHREVMKLPADWPRLNSWPEWFTASNIASVVSAVGLPQTPTVEQLQAGLPLDLPAGADVEIRLKAK